MRKAAEVEHGIGLLKLRFERVIFGFDVAWLAILTGALHAAPVRSVALYEFQIPVRRIIAGIARTPSRLHGDAAILPDTGTAGKDLLRRRFNCRHFSNRGRRRDFFHRGLFRRDLFLRSRLALGRSFAGGTRSGQRGAQCFLAALEKLLTAAAFDFLVVLLAHKIFWLVPGVGRRGA